MKREEGLDETMDNTILPFSRPLEGSCGGVIGPLQTAVHQTGVHAHESSRLKTPDVTPLYATSPSVNPNCAEYRRGSKNKTLPNLAMRRMYDRDI